MRTILRFTFFTFLLLYSGIISAGKSGRQENLSSPDGKISVNFMLQEGVPNYSVSYDGTEMIQPSSLGFRFKEAPSLDKDFAVTGTRRSEYDESWSPVWGT
ncbi:MAG: glycoside hydrolase family 97 N-terminal domain-containing protein, partial [Calditrichia bacterium]